jgi:hypothetical protein
MNERTEKKAWNLAALFIIMLVISMPLYSAQSMAAINVQISKNQGEMGIDKYIDAEGDVWTVEAIISGTDADVNPEDLVVKIGNNEAEFESCSDSALGATCEYISPLSDGVKEDTYNFQVVYRYLDSVGYEQEKEAGDYLYADGSAPKVLNIDASQNTDNGDVNLDFTVSDNLIGIKLIEIINSDSNSVISTLGPYDIGKKEFDYSIDGGTQGQLSGSLFSGEGLQHIKIRAVDHLDHSETSPPYTFEGDFIKPEIVDLELTHFGKFVGEFNYPTDIMVDIIEGNRFDNEFGVRAYSDDADFNIEKAQCENDLEEDGLYHCYWRDVEVSPESQVSIKIVAKDEFGNTAEKTITKTFTKDVSGPKVKFFGTDRIYESQSYVKSDDQRVIVEITESGAGILNYDIDGEILGTDGIKVNLGPLGEGANVGPDSCEETSSGARCYWDTNEGFLGDGSLILSLSTFEDNVGNKGEAKPIEVIVDTTEPLVNKVSVFGVGGSAGEHDYFQSNDQIQLEMEISEINGLFVLVDVSEVIPNAEVDFPENDINRDMGDGWQIFTEEDCVREEGKWKCTFLTDKIMSGPSDNVKFYVQVQDTAGNPAVDWPEDARNVRLSSEKGKGLRTMQFNLLGLSTELDPNYWELVKGFPHMKSGIDFVDLETAQLANARIPFDVRFNTDNARAEALAVEVVPGSCRPTEETNFAAGVTVSEKDVEAAATEEAVEEESSDEAIAGAAVEVPVPTNEATGAPEISRSLIYGGNYPTGVDGPVTVSLILEFFPFDAKSVFGVESKDEFVETEVDYTCQFRIYSEVEGLATSLPELEEVEFTIPFGYSALGLRDENLDKKIGDIKDDIWFQIPDKLKIINKILQWVRYLSGIVGMATNVYNIIQSFMPADDTYRNDFPVYTSPLATTICGVKSTGAAKTLKAIEIAQVVVQVLSCNPVPSDTSWYGVYQTRVLQGFNLIDNGGIIQATSLYDNIWISLIGLCLPGVIYNLEKLRQIKCTHINCLETFVPQGISTVKGCQRMANILECKFWWGELVGQLVPLTGLMDAVKGMVKSALTNPVGLIRSSIVWGCSFSQCGTSSTGNAFCNYAGVFVYVVDLVDNILGMVQQYPSISQDYCSQVGEGGWI